LLDEGVLRDVIYVKQPVGDIRMPRPIPSVSRSAVAKELQESQPMESPKSSPEYAEKLRLAADLHAQGIDPIRWTAAQPADWATQQAFQKTGQKDDRHFVVGGRLYRTTSQVAANQAQGQDALDVYLGADAKPVEQLVDIAKVPLTHPAGRPHDTKAHRPDAHALNLHYARVGVDPASAHNGDPLPMETQPKLQQATRMADGSEIPLGIPGIYRGYDNGYFYAANDGTKESADVQALRRKLATEKAQAQGDASAMVANDNDPEIDEAVARHYAKQESITPATQNMIAYETLEQQNAQVSNSLPQLFSAIEKFQKGEPLSIKESDLLVHVGDVFSAIDIPIDLKKVDVKLLRQAAERGAGNPQSILNADSANSPSPLIAGATLAIPAGGLSFPGLRAATAAAGALLEAAAAGTTAVGGTVLATLVGGFLAAMTKSTQTQQKEDADLRRGEELMAASRKLGQENQNPSPENEISEVNQRPSSGSTVPQSAAAASAPTLIIQPFAAPADFKPESKYMWDAQKDFAHALLQGQLPEIWVNGQQITLRNPYGSRGKPIVQQLDKSAADAIAKALEECPDVENVEHVGGGSEKQLHVKDPDSVGNLNSARPDISFKFQHGEYTCQYHVNTADTNLDGSLSAREDRNATRLMSNIEKVVRKFAEAINQGMIPEDTIGGAGHAFDHMPKPTTDSESEVNAIIEEFMEEVFSCTEITRECERTSPMKIKGQATD
jgi:hypothetical protein